MTQRKSSMAFIVAKLSVSGDSHFLFMRHRKWGDWGLVGGHTEPGEEGNWLATALREANEELAPLVAGQDFDLRPLSSEPITWGPVRSRSARNELTLYTAQYFALHFRLHPAALLRRLDAKSFLLVPEAHLLDERWDDDVADTLRRLTGPNGDGLRTVPLAWNEDLTSEELGVPVRPFSEVSVPRMLAAGGAR
jgi:8-oxo-dGTP pyrophosphatase MutT (NUDIX family)